MFIENKTIEYMNDIPIHIEFGSIRHCRPHYHISDLEIVYCLEGQAYITSGFEKVTLRQGEFFTSNCGEVHYIHSDADNILMTVHINLQNLPADWDFLKHIIFVLENLDDITRNAYMLDEITDMIITAALLFTETGCGEKLRSIAEAITDILCSHFSYIDYINEYKPVSDSVKQIYFSFSEYIYNNYNSKISISDFAGSNYMDKSHLSYLLKSNVHKTFSDSLSYVRCNHAELLLLATNKPNDEISHMCGFSDVKYFYAKFREWYGKTPAVHRREFEGYMAEPDIMTLISPNEMNGFMQKYFCEYHKNKTICKCTKREL